MRFKNRKQSCYLNLHKSCISVKDSKDGVDHVSAIALYDVQFHVNQRGREKVLSTGHKNVHAYVKGYVKPLYGKQPIPEWKDMEIIKYNPYKAGHFYDDKGREVTKASYVLVTPDGVYAYMADGLVDSM